MDELEDLFDEGANDEKYREPVNYVKHSVDKLVTNIEAEFTGADTAEFSRAKEKAEINDKIKDAETRLKKIKNPQGTQNLSPDRRAAITIKLSEKRESVRKEIERYKLRLSEIEIEEGKSSDKDNKKEVKHRDERKDKLRETLENKNNARRRGGPTMGFSKAEPTPNKNTSQTSQGREALKECWKSTNPYDDI